MTIYLPPTGTLLDYRLCYVGDPAMSAHGQAMVDSSMHLRRWRSNDCIATYFGRPDESVNGNLTSGAAGSETVGTFYIFSAFPVRVDAATLATRELIFHVRRWLKDYTAVAGTERWTWYPDAGAAGNTVLMTADADTGGVSDTYENSPGGQKSTWRVTVTPGTADDGFVLSKMTCTRVLPAIVQVSAAPCPPVISSAAAIYPPAEASVGRTLRGYDGGPGKSIGAVTHYIDQATDGVVQSTRRCLFQTPYVLGAYQEASASAYLRQDLDGNPQLYRVEARNLDGGSGRITCDVALCITADEGAKITIEAYDAVGGAAQDAWAYAVGAGGDTAAKVTTSDGTSTVGGAGIGLSIKSTAASYVGIKATTMDGETPLECRLHTVSLWEPATGGR